MNLFEMGPRDGLQNEKNVLSLADKVWLIDGLSSAGFKNIEAGALVRADKVPQMADSDQISEKLSDDTKKNSTLWYLVPNLKGLDRAIAKGIKNIAVFTAVSETFNQKNIGMSVAESLDEIKQVIEKAKAHSIQVRGYVSTVWGCPFEGRMTSAQSVPVIEKLLNLGVFQVSIGDTIGVANPRSVTETLNALQSSVGISDRLAVHFHDTRGTALANTLKSYELGIRTMDASLGGLGGCPFAPGAAGNLATEDLLYALKEMGIKTGIDYEKTCKLSLALARRMGKNQLSSKALQAYQANCEKNTTWDS